MKPWMPIVIAAIITLFFAYIGLFRALGDVAGRFWEYPILLFFFILMIGGLAE